MGAERPRSHSLDCRRTGSSWAMGVTGQRWDRGEQQQPAIQISKATTGNGAAATWGRKSKVGRAADSLYKGGSDWTAASAFYVSGPGGAAAAHCAAGSVLILFIQRYRLSLVEEERRRENRERYEQGGSVHHSAQRDRLWPGAPSAAPHYSRYHHTGRQAVASVCRSTAAAG